MAFYTIQVNDATQLFDWLGQIDQLLTIVTANNDPQGNYAAGSVGVWAFRPDTGGLWICTATDATGNPAGTTWEAIVFSLGTATTTTPGAVALATNAQTIAGTDTATAVTPAGAAAAYVKLADYNTEITTLQTEISAIAAVGGTPAATPNTVMARDGNAQANVGAPTASTHIATKQYVDALGTTVNSFNTTISTLQGLLGAATDQPTPNSLAQRNGAGQSSFATPTSSTHAVNKLYADTDGPIAQAVLTGTANPTALKIVVRDASGFAQVNASSDPSTTSKAIATLGQLNTLNATVVANGSNLLSALATLAAAVPAATPNTLALRDGSGNLSVGTPTAPSNAANKAYVDAAAGRPNILINGGFTFFRRQVPGTATGRASGAYGPDRFYMLGSSTAADIQAKQINDAGAGLNHQFACQVINGNAAAKNVGIAQALTADDTIPLRGQQVTFSFLSKVGTGTPNLRAAIVEFTGTPDAVNFGGTTGRDPVSNWASTTYTAGNFFKNTNIVVSSVSASLPQTTGYATFSVTGTVSTAATNLVLLVWEESTIASGASFTITQCNLAVGSSVRAWLPGPIELERAACARFFQTSYTDGVAPGTGGSSGGILWNNGNPSFNSSQSNQVFCPVRFAQMRNIPVVTLYSYQNGAANALYCFTHGGNRTGISATNPGDSGFAQISCPSGGTTNIDQSEILGFQFTADAEV